MSFENVRAFYEKSHLNCFMERTGKRQLSRKSSILGQLRLRQCKHHIKFRGYALSATEYFFGNHTLNDYRALL